MKIIKKLLKGFLFVLAIPLLYVIVSLILTSITVDKKDTTTVCAKSIFISSNGVHLDVILPIQNVSNELLEGLNVNSNYLSLGWGDENFYINTPTWNDLTFGNAFQAIFMKSSTLMHVTRYNQIRKDWIEIKINDGELQKLNQYILSGFQKDALGNKIILENKGYTFSDDFYKANGSYSCFKTCNSWVNSGFKESGLKSCYWTPFDFGLLNKYE